MKRTLDLDALQDIFISLIDLIGEENTLLIWENYKGGQLSIPSHLYNRKKVSQLINRQQGPIDSRKVAVKYGYSEKWVRQIMRNSHEDN
ncbi:Mor transcription activator family protein [Lacticaseibacillus saniviri]